MVKAQGEELLVKTVTPDQINEIVKTLVPRDYSASSGDTIKGFENEKVTRFFAAKNIKVGVISSVRTFIEADGVLCTEKEEENLISLSTDDFVSAVFDIVKGAL